MSSSDARTDVEVILMAESTKSTMPTVRRKSPQEGKPVLIEKAFGSKPHLTGRVGTLECEKIRGFFVIEVLRKPNGSGDVTWYRVAREVRGRPKEVEHLLDWDDPAPKKVGDQRRMPNYTFRFAVDDEHIHADECDWRPLYCKATTGGSTCGGKLFLENGHIACQVCGATYSVDLVKGFPEAERLLGEEARGDEVGA